MLIATSKPVQYRGSGASKNSQLAIPWSRHSTKGNKLAYATSAAYRAASGHAVDLCTVRYRQNGLTTTKTTIAVSNSTGISLNHRKNTWLRWLRPASNLRNITEHPLAGQMVKITLVATDGAGQTGRSEPIEMLLPVRLQHSHLGQRVDALHCAHALIGKNWNTDLLGTEPRETVTIRDRKRLFYQLNLEPSEAGNQARRLLATPPSVRIKPQCRVRDSSYRFNTRLIVNSTHFELQD